MRRRRILAALLLPAACLLFNDPDADADPGVAPLPSPPGIGGGGGSGGGGFAGEPGIGGGPNLSPNAASALFLCPGVGQALNMFGSIGGFWCDFDWQQVVLPGPPGIGVMHVHCEGGGFAPVAAAWSCWRVWPGRADHDPTNQLDPDVIPEGFTTPWALNGPTPTDQWPPLGLAPAQPPEPPPP